jgi:aminoglycoside phosphotransferase (APT) family kinase protein
VLYDSRVASPGAEIDVDEGMVRDLLEAQHPDLAGLPLRLLDAGWDNTSWRLGDELLVRLPRREAAAGLTLHEQRWLPGLAPFLPLPVPVPLRTGVADDVYPWRWTVVPWIDGVPGDRAELVDPIATAERLGRFLRALHRPASPEAPTSEWRGVPLARRSDTMAQRLDTLAGEVDTGFLRALWRRALNAPAFEGPARWLHGDLHPANTLVRDGTLAAVIDFGDLCAGDPATDIAGAWMLLPTAAIPAFFDAYGAEAASPGLSYRSAGWAALLALMLLEIGLDDKPTYAVVARATIRRLQAGLADAAPRGSGR